MVDLHYILLKINNAEDFDLEYVHQNTSYGTINRDFLKKRKEIQTRSFNRDSTIRCLGLHFSDRTVRLIEIF